MNGLIIANIAVITLCMAVIIFEIVITIGSMKMSKKLVKALHGKEGSEDESSSEV